MPVKLTGQSPPGRTLQCTITVTASHSQTSENEWLEARLLCCWSNLHPVQVRSDFSSSHLQTLLFNVDKQLNEQPKVRSCKVYVSLRYIPLLSQRCADVLVGFRLKTTWSLFRKHHILANVKMLTGTLVTGLAAFSSATPSPSTHIFWEMSILYIFELISGLQETSVLRDPLYWLLEGVEATTGSLLLWMGRFIWWSLMFKGLKKLRYVDTNVGSVLK